MSTVASPNDEIPSFQFSATDKKSGIVSCTTSADMRKLYGDIIAPQLYDDCELEKIDGKTLHDVTKLKVSLREGSDVDLHSFFESLKSS